MKSQVLGKGFLLTVCLLSLFSFTVHGHSDPDSLVSQEKIKKGLNHVPLPVVGYDADMGFQYGALYSLSLYGDGSKNPDYLHKFYFEVSRFTKGSGVNQFFYDSKYLIPGMIRLTFDLSYLTENALDFYGFNGYQSSYWSSVTDDESDDYISRVYYKHERKLLRINADLQGPVIGQKLRWLAGISFFDTKTGTVDVERINKGKKESKQLPDTTLLYDEYTERGILSEDERDGGNSTCFKLGLIYDTRDNEYAPNRGIWSEIILITAPDFLGTDSYTKLAVMHRQFFPLVHEKLVFGYRLAYQGFLSKDPPFYMLPYIFTSFSLTTKPDGLGGAQNLRGVLRNRAVGDGMAFGNIELRWIFFRSRLFKMPFYLGLTGFFDGGMVVQEREVDREKFGDLQEFFFDESNDHLHLGTGLGLRISLGEDFILTVDYGFALDKRDGTSGLYIGVANIF